MSENPSVPNLVDLYDQLVPPDPPLPVSMWPQTAGWLWLAAAMAVAIGLILWRWTVWRRSTAYRRAALEALKQAGDDPRAIANTLRRTALAGFPRAEVTELYGAEWLAFLDRSADQAIFSGTDAGDVLAAAPYRPQPPHSALPALAEKWIKTHHTKRGAS
jgi:hypothetical protein